MSNSSSQGAYYIQQVADITKISKQLIRKWEDRYQLVHPERLENGYRVYSDKDINILLAAKSYVEQGYSIKQVAQLVKEGELPVEQVTHQQDSQQKYVGMNEYVLRLLENGLHCNEQGMNLVLQQAFHQHGLGVLIDSVIRPFLKEVGFRWEKQEWSEFQEALASMVVRDFLIQIRRNFQYRDNAPLLIGACLPNEQHEVPVHLLLVQAMLRGWKTILIGVSPAPNSIESVVETLKPDKILLSATTTVPFTSDLGLVDNLERIAGKYKEVDFYLGGAGSLSYMQGRKLSNVLITNSIEEVFN